MLIIRASGLCGVGKRVGMDMYGFTDIMANFHDKTHLLVRGWP